MNNEDGAHYRAYLLRYWWHHGERAAGWRCSLEDPHTGERRFFASLPALLAYLERESVEYGEAGPDGEDVLHKGAG